MTGTPDTGRDPAAPPRMLFLEQSSYRRRRLMDAARLLPLLGAVLFAVPLLWPQADDLGSEGTVRMSSAIQYIFVSWGLLIGIAVLFGLGTRHLGDGDAGAQRRD